MSKALILIDLQNDYFSGGKFPLWNTEKVLTINVELIKKAKEKQMPIIVVQHVGEVGGPFFTPESEGVKVHTDILKLLPDAPVIVKTFADSFYQTELEDELQKRGIKDIYLSGMMTQNCVTHTAISKSAEKYKVNVITDACTTVSEMIHLIALNALSIRVKLLKAEEF